MARIHAIVHADYTTNPRTAITRCGEHLALPEWTGYGWTFEPRHTLDEERVTCDDCSPDVPLSVTVA